MSEPESQSLLEEAQAGRTERSPFLAIGFVALAVGALCVVILIILAFVFHWV